MENLYISLPVITPSLPPSPLYNKEPNYTITYNKKPNYTITSNPTTLQYEAQE